MDIKVGDKIRVKTEEELLAEGWVQDDKNTGILVKNGSLVFRSLINKIGIISGMSGEEVSIDNDFTIEKQFIAEVLPQTLDEYICSLSLEERAQALSNAGYRKTVWHKVADGDLPKRDDLYLCVCGKPNGMHWALVNYIDDGFYDVKNNYSEIDVIAWTELPKYEE